jgi:hypothetical protein
MDAETASIMVTSMPYAIEAILTGGGALISGAFWRLWKRVDSDHKKVQEEWIKCEDEHQKTQTELSHLREDLGYLKGRQEATENLARNVLEVVARND